MSTEEKIEIMQAYLDGKTIQVENEDGWVDIKDHEPLWTWQTNRYRIKPSARPYTMAEMNKAALKHGGYIYQQEESVWLVGGIRVNGVISSDDSTYFTYNELAELDYRWLDDDSPCGVMEEE